MAAKTDDRQALGDDIDADALLAELEAEDDSSYRQQRLQELKSEAAESQSHPTMTKENAYSTLSSDDQFLQFTTTHERALVHFFHSDFARCITMDTHCQHIADKHTEYGNADVAFGRVDVNNAPFVVEKLGVRVLPCVIGFVKGIAKGRVTGFEGIVWGGKEESKTTTLALEERCVEWGVLGKKLLADVDDMDDEENEGEERKGLGRRGIKGRKHEVVDEDDDWD